MKFLFQLKNGRENVVMIKPLAKSIELKIVGKKTAIPIVAAEKSNVLTEVIAKFEEKIFETPSAWEVAIF
jgi:hypothetical protein